MVGIITGVFLIISYCLWCCCKVAGDADKIIEESQKKTVDL
jgi:hypothetical protein